MLVANCSSEAVGAWVMADKKRSDAERRLRQCERLGRLLRTLHLIMGRGRWDADALAEELECSRRTVHRMLQTLSIAGVPWYFDESCRAYRVRPGFRFPGIEQATANLGQSAEHLPSEVRPLATKLMADGEAFAASLRDFLDALGKASRDCDS